MQFFTPAKIGNENAACEILKKFELGKTLVDMSWPEGKNYENYVEKRHQKGTDNFIHVFKQSNLKILHSTLILLRNVRPRDFWCRCQIHFWFSKRYFDAPFYILWILLFKWEVERNNNYKNEKIWNKIINTESVLLTMLNMLRWNLPDSIWWQRKSQKSI